jgi:hypothetical protein
MTAIEPIQLDQVCVCQNLKAVGIGEQLNAANALTDKGLELVGITSPEESTNRDEVLGG